MGLRGREKVSGARERRIKRIGKKMRQIRERERKTWTQGEKVIRSKIGMEEERDQTLQKGY